MAVTMATELCPSSLRTAREGSALPDATDPESAAYDLLRVGT